MREFPLLVDGDERFAREEVVDAEAHELGVGAVVALIELALVVVQTEQLGSVQFFLGEALLPGLLAGCHGGHESAQNGLLLAAHTEREGILRAAEEEAGGTGRGTLEGRHGLLFQLGEAIVQHPTDEPVDIVAAQIVLGVLLIIGRSLALHVEMAEHDGLFGVFLYIDNHLLVVANGIIHTLGTILGQGDGREHLLDLLLHLVHIDIAHHYDSLQVGAIPLIIIVAQVLIGEVIDNVHRANGHAVLILGAGIDLGHGLLHEPLNGTACPSRAPLLVNHAALLVYLGILEQQVVAPVVEHEQTGIENALALERGRSDVIDGLVDGGVGIEVGTKLHADGLAPRHDAQSLAFAGEVLRAVEGHVLQEVSQSALPWLLLDGAHALGNIEIGQSGFLGIVTDVVGQSVLQLARAHLRILWQRCLSRRAYDCRQQRE